MTNDKKRIAYIKKYPKLARTRIYERWKGTRLGIRKQRALKLIRKTRNIRAPTLKQRKQHIPIKYRRRKPDIRPEPEPPTKYFVRSVMGTDYNGREKLFHIKYQDEKDFQRQLRRIESAGNAINRESVTRARSVPYKEFVAKEFRMRV